MNTNSKFMKNIVLHIKYPYTAFIISIMWIAIAIIIAIQGSKNLEVLVVVTACCTLLISAIGFRSPR